MAKKPANKDVKPRAKQSKNDPSGIRELTDDELGAVTGGSGNAPIKDKVYKQRDASNIIVVC